jgi:hypothetical protein
MGGASRPEAVIELGKERPFNVVAERRGRYGPDFSIVNDAMQWDLSGPWSGSACSRMLI